MIDEKIQQLSEETVENRIDSKKENSLVENITSEESVVDAFASKASTEENQPETAVETDWKKGRSNNASVTQEAEGGFTEIDEQKASKETAGGKQEPESVGTKDTTEIFRRRRGRPRKSEVIKTNNNVHIPKARLSREQFASSPKIGSNFVIDQKTDVRLAYFEAACAVKSFLLGYQVLNLESPLFKNKNHWFELYKHVKRVNPPNTTISQAAFLIDITGRLAIAKKFANEAEREDWMYFSDLDLQESRSEPIAFIIYRITRRFFTVKPITGIVQRLEPEGDRLDKIKYCCRVLCMPTVWRAVETIANLIVDGNPPSNEQAEYYFATNIDKAHYAFGQ